MWNFLGQTLNDFCLHCKLNTNIWIGHYASSIGYDVQRSNYELGIEPMIDLPSIGAIAVFRFISLLSGRSKDDAIASFLDAGASASFRDEMGYWYAVRVAAIETLFPDAGNGRTRFNGCDYGRLIRNAALANPAIRRRMRAECADGATQ